jgi:hypothetical protein
MFVRTFLGGGGGGTVGYEFSEPFESAKNEQYFKSEVSFVLLLSLALWINYLGEMMALKVKLW